MRIVLLSLLFCCLVSLHAQIPSSSDNKTTLTSSGKSDGEIKNTPTMQPLPQQAQSAKANLKLHVVLDDTLNNRALSATENPAYDYHPVQNPDLNLYNQYRLNDFSWIDAYRNKVGYVCLGGITTIGADVNGRLGSSLIFSTGLYTSRFNLNTDQYTAAGLKGGFKLKISDRISMNVNGQYNFNHYNLAMPQMSSMYPQSSYGGSFEFKVTEKWGVVVGAEREFDVMKHKWVTVPYILPVFYSH